jgi:hypothetical protein
MPIKPIINISWKPKIKKSASTPLHVARSARIIMLLKNTLAYWAFGGVFFISHPVGFVFDPL